jgi:hypothetical protein
MATVLRGASPGLCRYVQKEQITRKHKGKPLGFDNPLGNDVLTSIDKH